MYGNELICYTYVATESSLGGMFTLKPTKTLVKFTKEQDRYKENTDYENVSMLVGQYRFLNKEKLHILQSKTIVYDKDMGCEDGDDDDDDEHDGQIENRTLSQTQKILMHTISIDNNPEHIHYGNSLEFVNHGTQTPTGWVTVHQLAHSMKIDTIYCDYDDVVLIYPDGIGTWTFVHDPFLPYYSNTGSRSITTISNISKNTIVGIIPDTLQVSMLRRLYAILGNKETALYILDKETGLVHTRYSWKLSILTMTLVCVVVGVFCAYVIMMLSSKSIK
jgi:hypothetical protein